MHGNFIKLFAEHEKTVEKLKTVEKKNEELCAENEVIIIPFLISFEKILICWQKRMNLRAKMD